MRSAVMVSPGKIEFHDIEKPVPGPGQVLLKITRIGICGSDVHVNHGRHPFTSYPVIQGHEFSSVVAEVGEGVENVRVGMKATATPQVVCGRCAPCRRGDYNICNELKVWGFQTSGVAQDFFAVSAGKIVPLPDDFTEEMGALVEPVAVAVHSTSRAGDLRSKNVVVAGAGPIGNLVAQVCSSRGANVLSTDLSGYRLDVARMCGIRNTANLASEPLSAAAVRVFGSTGFDIAIECSGSQGAISDLVANVNKGGRIIIVGVFQDKPRIDMSIIGDRELSLAGSLMYRKPDFEEAVRLMSRGEIRTTPLDSRHFPYSEFPAAYRFIDEAKDRIMKVFIDF